MNIIQKLLDDDTIFTTSFEPFPDHIERKLEQFYMTHITDDKEKLQTLERLCRSEYHRQKEQHNNSPDITFKKVNGRFFTAFDHIEQRLSAIMDWILSKELILSNSGSSSEIDISKLQGDEYWKTAYSIYNESDKIIWEQVFEKIEELREKNGLTRKYGNFSSFKRNKSKFDKKRSSS